MSEETVGNYVESENAAEFIHLLGSDHANSVSEVLKMDGDGTLKEHLDEKISEVFSDPPRQKFEALRNYLFPAMLSQFISELKKDYLVNDLPEAKRDLIWQTLEDWVRGLPSGLSFTVISKWKAESLAEGVVELGVS